MNPDEQRSHKTATDRLAARLGNVETVADRFETVEGVLTNLGTWLAGWSGGVVGQLEAAEARAAAADALLVAQEARIVALETAVAAGRQAIAALEAALETANVIDAPLIYFHHYAGLWARLRWLLSGAR